MWALHDMNIVFGNELDLGFGDLRHMYRLQARVEHTPQVTASRDPVSASMPKAFAPPKVALYNNW